MKILSKKALKELVLYSPQHVDRLEKAGKFPKRVEQFCAVQASRLPRRYIEGMAYSISQDPRDPLPRRDIQTWRTQFNMWIEEGNDWRQPPQD